MTDATKLETHFAFGENWESYASLVDESRIEGADAGMRRLFPEGLVGRSFLDIGSGSGIHALSAIRMGATVECIDIDPNSVAATRSTLARADPTLWSARVDSVFDLQGQYDVVYSWGALHHTGDMWRAIGQAASLVKPGGRLALAIYTKTAMCGFWKVEKAFYTKAPRFVQALIRTAYVTLLGIALLAKGRNPFAFWASDQVRGMDRKHDLHDWLGGYPYESATPEEVRLFLAGLGFSRTVLFARPGRQLGIFGSGCDEYVFERRVAGEPTQHP